MPGNSTEIISFDFDAQQMCRICASRYAFKTQGSVEFIGNIGIGMENNAVIMIRTEPHDMLREEPTNAFPTILSSHIKSPQSSSAV